MTQTTYEIQAKRLGTYDPTTHQIRSAALDAAGSDVIRVGACAAFSATTGKIVPMSAGAVVFGVAVRSAVSEVIAETDTKPEYKAGDSVPLLFSGTAVVYVEEAVSAGDALSVRVSGENNTTTFRGNLAKTTDAAREALPGVRALETISAAGLCRVAFNLPQ